MLTVNVIINMEPNRNCWDNILVEAAGSNQVDLARQGTDLEKAKSRCTKAILVIVGIVGIHTGACSVADRYCSVLEASPSWFGDLFELALFVVG